MEGEFHFYPTIKKEKKRIQKDEKEQWTSDLFALRKERDSCLFISRWIKVFEMNLQSTLLGQFQLSSVI